MSLLLNALLIAGYAYLFRTQVSDFTVAIKADWAWIKGFFVKPAPVVTTQVAPPGSSADKTGTAPAAAAKV